jgi:hypothetical protein
MSKPVPPPIHVPADWEMIHLPFNVGSGRTMYTGQEPDGKARFRFYRKPGDGAIYGRAWFGPGTEGPPAAVHGGALAYALDEAMGSLAWLNLYPAVALKLEFQYLKLSPLNVDLHLEARLVSAGKSRLEIESTVALPDGSICVEGKGSFAILTRTQAEAFKPLDKDGVMGKMKLKWADD